MTREAELYNRDELKRARASAVQDAEGFQDILFALERLGAACLGRIGGLSDYRDKLCTLALRSPLAQAIPEVHPQFHARFERLFRIIQKSRNDALHQGAFARHLTDHCAELALVLEDALVNDSRLVTDYMVSSPVRAFLWQPLSLVRQQMLKNSYSFLPIKVEGQWELISDSAIARMLRSAYGKERDRRLGATIEEAMGLYGLQLTPAVTVPWDSTVEEIVESLDQTPRLVVGNDGRMLGILTAFDIL